MRYFVEASIILFLTLYYTAGITQLLTALRIKRKAMEAGFSKKDFFVSVVIPIRGAFEDTHENLKSVCNQDYATFEVIFVAESKTHDAYNLAMEIANSHPNVRVLISGPHDPKKSIAKCHNLVFAVHHARGNVFLFGDSDVLYPRDWIRKMTDPLGEFVQGKQIDATTAPFFIAPSGFFGKLIALPVSHVTFTSSFTRESQRFPSYASGASMAITKELFDKAGISKVWERSFNDDLVFANTLRSRGYNIYNQHASLNHPHEYFGGFKQTMNKLVRWVITVSHFGHRNLKRETPLMLILNLQFQVSFALSLALFLAGVSGLFALTVFVLGFTYSVFYRWALGIIVNERGMTSYYIMAPVMGVVLILYYLFVRLFLRKFSWEGEQYRVRK